MASAKKITRQYKGRLTKAEQKVFRALLWEFRRAPQELTAVEWEKLEQLFAKLPRLRELYDLRHRFKEVFDSHCSRRTAKSRLRNLLLEASEAFPPLERFLETYLTWEEQILNYFDAYETSAAVEGLNNKARVIIKRAYGLKSAASLRARLVLEVNKVTEAATTTIARIRELVNGFRRVFSPLCS
jgi:transposase